MRCFKALIDLGHDRTGLVRELQRLLSRSLAAAGEMHLTSATITGNIGQSFDFMRRPKEAAAYYHRCLRVREALLGAAHPMSRYTRECYEACAQGGSIYS